MCSLYVYAVLKNIHFASIILLITTGCITPFLWVFATFFVEEGFPARRYCTYICVLLAICTLIPDPAVYIKMCSIN